jgi:hypothetical protein
MDGPIGSPAYTVTRHAAFTMSTESLFCKPRQGSTRRRAAPSQGFVAWAAALRIMVEKR